MKSILITGFLFLQFFSACTNGTDENSSEDDLGTARAFIRSALDGNYKNAETLIIPDSTNTQYLDIFKRNYKDRMTKEDKKGYKESSINIHNVAKINDSTTVVRYSNSFKKKQDSVKVVRTNGKWLVDFKYSSPQTGLPEW